jgi:prepilin-type N-terminal cleavage/methylation domain-containing protein
LYKSGCQTILLIIKEIKTMRKDTGFSLIELITVMAILSLLCTFAVPSLFEWLPKHRVGSAARDVKSTLEFARSNAIKTNSDVSVEFDNDSLKVTSGGTTLRTRQLPADVDLAENFIESKVTFNGHGFSDKSGQVDVENKTNTALQRSISLTIGGNSRIQ